MIRTSNQNASQYVEQFVEFNGNNTYARWEQGTHDKFYVVYSYGSHFPMFVYDEQLNQWFENSDKYSRTTSKQQSQLRPRLIFDVKVMSRKTTQELKDLVFLSAV